MGCWEAVIGGLADLETDLKIMVHVAQKSMGLNAFYCMTTYLPMLPFALKLCVYSIARRIRLLVAAYRSSRVGILFQGL